MGKVENFIKRIRWKAHRQPMMSDNDNYRNYGLRSNIPPPQNPALTSFKNDIYNMERNIEFRKVLNDFQDKLKKDIREIRSSGQVNEPVRNVRHRLQQIFR